MKYLVMMILLQFCLTNIVTQNYNNKELIKKAFNTWNEKTIGSINEQIILTKNPQIKSDIDRCSRRFKAFLVFTDSK